MRKELNLKNKMLGVGMIEILVGIVISSLLTIAVVTVYMSQNVMFKQQSSRNYAAADTWDVFSLVSGIIRHAQINSFAISYGGGGLNDDDPAEIELLGDDDLVANDEITVTFSVPNGMRVWPNDTAPYNNNVMRLTWQNSGDNPYQVTIETNNGAGFEPPIVLAGGNAGVSSQIINFDLWPLDAEGNRQPLVTSAPVGGYQLIISTRAAMSAGESDPVFTVSGVVVPRNS